METRTTTMMPPPCILPYFAVSVFSHAPMAVPVLSTLVDQDHASNGERDRRCLFSVKLPFPCKLHEMLEWVESNGFSHIVSWQPHGKAFRVRHPEDFVKKIMPNFFKQSIYKSFQRQLHVYGFKRINSKGNLDVGSYYHPLFVKQAKNRCLSMYRQKVKGSAAYTKTHTVDPDFYEHEPILINKKPGHEDLNKSNDGLSPLQTTYINLINCNHQPAKSLGNGMFNRQERPLEQPQEEPKFATSWINDTYPLLGGPSTLMNTATTSGPAPTHQQNEHNGFDSNFTTMASHGYPTMTGQSTIQEDHIGRIKTVNSFGLPHSKVSSSVPLPSNLSASSFEGRQFFVVHLEEEEVEVKTNHCSGSSMVST